MHILILEVLLVMFLVLAEEQSSAGTLDALKDEEEEEEEACKNIIREVCHLQFKGHKIIKAFMYH